LLSNTIDNAINFSLIVVHGPPSSGKSLILNHVLTKKSINHVYVSCRGLSTVRQFFDVMLNGIYERFQSNRSSKKPLSRNQNRENVPSTKATSDPELDGYWGWRKHSDFKYCNSASIFAHILQNEDISGKKSFYIVLDHFQRLSQIQSGLLSSLIQITEIEPLYQATESKLGFILIDDSSAMVQIKELLGNKHIIALPVCFEQYSNRDLQSILMEKSSSMFAATKYTKSQRKTIIQFLVNTLSQHEPRRIDRFLQYLALLMPDLMEMDSSKSMNLTLKLEHRLSNSQHLTLDFMNDISLTADYESEPKEPDLPYASKLLLLSGYLASYNSHRWNQYQFADVQTKRSRRKKVAPKPKDEYSLRERGPQAFTLRDLSGIFIKLFKQESPAEYNGDLKIIQDIHSQIAHLISLSFISMSSREGTLDDVKFKCNIHHDFAAFVAKKINIRTWKDYLETSGAAHCN